MKRQNALCTTNTDKYLVLPPLSGSINGRRIASGGLSVVHEYMNVYICVWRFCSTLGLGILGSRE